MPAAAGCAIADGRNHGCSYLRKKANGIVFWPSGGSSAVNQARDNCTVLLLPHVAEIYDVHFGKCDIRLRRPGLRSNRDWIPNNLTSAREKLGTDVYGSPRTAVYYCLALWLELPCRLSRSGAISTIAVSLG